MLTINAEKPATRTLLIAYLVVFAGLAIWMSTRMDELADPNSTVMRDYARAVALISITFLALSAIPALRWHTPAAAFALAFLLTAPSLINKPSVTETVLTAQAEQLAMMISLDTP